MLNAGLRKKDRINARLRILTTHSRSTGSFPSYNVLEPRVPSDALSQSEVLLCRDPHPEDALRATLPESSES
jgi:hypothetical protein